MRLAAAGLAWALCAFGAAAGTVAQAAQPLQLTGQRDHAMCPLPGRDARAWLIDEPARWSAAITPEAALGRAVHWGQEMLLVVALAEQPTLGIRVSLDEPVRQRFGRRLELQARVQRPGPGEMAATAISRPCVVAAVPKVRWRRVLVWLEGRRIEAEHPPAGVPASKAEPLQPAIVPDVLPRK
jgi:hypothetical protein